MRWILLLVGITLHGLVMSQSTLKIYVVNDDIRSDMDIIDLNTSALDRYGQSVDSTNMNYYTTTMSTQVVRVSKLELFGPEEEVIIEDVEEDELTAGLDFIDTNSAVKTPSQLTSNTSNLDEEEESARANPTKSSTVRESTSDRQSISSKSYRPKQKVKRPKKSRKNKRYRGQCPRFF